jgi:hypothetical protein
MWKSLGLAFILAGPLPLSAQVAPVTDVTTAEAAACEVRAPERSCHRPPWSQKGSATSIPWPPLGTLQLDNETPAMTVTAAQIPRAAWPLVGCGAGAAVFAIITVFSDTRLSSGMLLGCVIGFAASEGANQNARSR